MKSKPFGALFGLLALVAILGVAPAFGQTANEVDIQAGAGSSASAACVTTNNCFSPNPITVAPGTEVDWKNGDTVSHTVTSGKVTDDNSGSLFDSGLIKNGNEFRFTFTNAGTFDYFCTVHPWMTGQIVVTGNTAPQPPIQQSPPIAPSGVDIAISQGSGTSASANCVSNNSCFSPNPLSVDPGRAVTWFNGDQLSHTITSGHVSDNNAGSLFDSGLIRSGGEFQFTFYNSGTFDYFCTVHPWMVGQVVVSGSNTPPQHMPPPVTNVILQVSTDKSSYSPGDIVTVSTSASGSSQGQNIAISVTDPSGNNFISRVLSTSDQGSSNLQFKIPETSQFGTYQVIATASVSGNSLKQTTHFTVNSQYAVSIVSAQSTDQQGNPVTSFTRGGIGYVKVVLLGQSNQNGLITINLFDSDSASLGIGSLKGSISNGQSEIVLSFSIPKDAVMGTANIYADVFSDYPSKGGTPLTKEISSTVEIK